MVWEPLIEILRRLEEFQGSVRIKTPPKQNDPRGNPVLPVRAALGVRLDGRFHSFGLPVEAIVTVTTAGNVGISAFPTEFVDGQIWILEMFTIVSTLGDILTGLIDGTSAGDSVTVAAAGSANLLAHPFTFDATLGISVTNGVAGDTYFLRARRIS